MTCPESHPDRIIGELAGRQHGVVARRQLLAAGFGRAMVDRRLRTERLLRVHPGVYATGHAPLRREGRWMAAVLAAGPDAVLSHRSAAGLHGIRPANGRVVDVTRPAGSTGPHGVRIHRTRCLDAAKRTIVDGIPTTTVARTLVDLAIVVAPDRLARALSEADRLRVLDMRAIERSVTRTATRRGHGHAMLTAALEELRAIAAPTRSPLEDAILRLLHRAALPAPRTNALVCGHEVDALRPERRLVVELDGWSFHRSRKAFQADRTRDRQLAVAGYAVVRLTHDDITRRAGQVVEELRTLLGAPDGPMVVFTER